MALSIEKQGIFKEYSIPLFGNQDPDWEDNTWIVGHLRQLADTIERDKLKIFKVSIDIDANYKIPMLNIVTLV